MSTPSARSSPPSSRRISHNVVAQDPRDHLATFHRVARVERRSPQPLLFPGRGQEDNRRVQPLVRKHSREFDDDGRPTRVVRARRVPCRVHRLSITRIVMPDDVIPPPRRFRHRPGQHRDHVHERPALRHPCHRWLLERLQPRLQPPPGRRAELIKLRLDPHPSRPDPARRACRVRQCVPRPERRKRFDVLFRLRRVDRRHDRPHCRWRLRSGHITARWRRADLRHHRR